MRRAIPLTVIVMTRDSAADLPACLAPLAAFDQVVVADSASADATRQIAAAAGATVVPFDWSGAYPKKKQWCLAHPALRHDRVLFVDSDERLPAEAVAELAAVAADPGPAAAWEATLRPVFAGRVLRFGRLHRKLVLLDRRRCRFGAIDDLDAPGAGEVEGHYQPTVDGPVARLRRPWVHDQGPPAAWVARHEAYARTLGYLEAADRAAVPPDERQPPLRALAKRWAPRLPGRAGAAFVDSYLLRAGWLDGRAGLDWALARAWFYWRIGVERRAIAAANAVGPPVGPGVDDDPIAVSRGRESASKASE
jgi:glycosyltransferase involved in cell wall biosynthesis